MSVSPSCVPKAQLTEVVIKWHVGIRDKNDSQRVNNFDGCFSPTVFIVCAGVNHEDATGGKPCVPHHHSFCKEDTDLQQITLKYSLNY